MDVKKTATDTAYIVVGVGVLGFQQAQVRRRDAMAKVATLRRDARGTLREQADKLQGCATQLGDRGRNLRSTVGTTVGTTVSSAADVVGTQVKAGTDAMKGVDPRAWVEPVVGDLKVRVEPVVEQLRTISLPEQVTSLPEQVGKAIEVGRTQVQDKLGAVTPAPLRSVVNG
jgi:hypothetical protein